MSDPIYTRRIENPTNVEINAVLTGGAIYESRGVGSPTEVSFYIGRNKKTHEIVPKVSTEFDPKKGAIFIVLSGQLHDDYQKADQIAVTPADFATKPIYRSNVTLFGKRESEAKGKFDESLTVIRTKELADDSQALLNMFANASSPKAIDLANKVANALERPDGVQVSVVTPADGGDQSLSVVTTDSKGVKSTTAVSQEEFIKAVRMLPEKQREEFSKIKLATSQKRTVGNVISDIDGANGNAANLAMGEQPSTPETKSTIEQLASTVTFPTGVSGGIDIEVSAQAGAKTGFQLG